MSFLPARRRPYGGLAPLVPFSFPSMFDTFERLRDWWPGERLTPREDGGTELRLDLPGFRIEEINVEVHGQQVRINASSDRGAERRRVAQTYNLGHEIDAGSVTATYEAGVLSLALPARGEPMTKIAVTGVLSAEPLAVGGEKSAENPEKE